MKVFIKGLNSCGMRKADVAAYHHFVLFNKHELVPVPEEADVILLWTCGFRRDSFDNSVSEIKRYARKFKARLVVTGCGPDIGYDEIRDVFKGEVIPWKQHERLEEIFGNLCKVKDAARVYGEPPLCTDVEKFRKENPDKDAAFHDKFIKIFAAEGCRFSCTYCSEALAFPPYRSFPLAQLVETCRSWVEVTGRREVMLMGDSIGDYGSDVGGVGNNLPALIDAVLGIDPEVKVAIQGFNPAHFIRFFSEMKGFLQNGKIAHLQIPIQSASPKILAAMKRPYTLDEIENVFSLLNSLSFTEFDTHLIVGFPGEQEDDVQMSLDFVLRHHPKYVLVSGFMEKYGMPAFRLFPKVSEVTQTRRINLIGEKIRAAGIICNTENSDLMAERCRRLNNNTCG